MANNVETRSETDARLGVETAICEKCFQPIDRDTRSAIMPMWFHTATGRLECEEQANGK
jgi:hypothetical protein